MDGREQHDSEAVSGAQAGRKRSLDNAASELAVKFARLATMTDVKVTRSVSGSDYHRENFRAVLLRRMSGVDDSDVESSSMDSSLVKDEQKANITDSACSASHPLIQRPYNYDSEMEAELEIRNICRLFISDDHVEGIRNGFEEDRFGRENIRIKLFVNVSDASCSSGDSMFVSPQRRQLSERNSTEVASTSTIRTCDDLSRASTSRDEIREPQSSSGSRPVVCSKLKRKRPLTKKQYDCKRNKIASDSSTNSSELETQQCSAQFSSTFAPSNVNASRSETNLHTDMSEPSTSAAHPEFAARSGSHCGNRYPKTKLTKIINRPQKPSWLQFTRKRSMVARKIIAKKPRLRDSSENSSDTSD